MSDKTCGECEYFGKKLSSCPKDTKKDWTECPARTAQRKAEHERDAACKRFESYAINNTHWGVENSELRDTLEEISDRASEYECECEHDFETGKLESVCLRCVVFRILKESKINSILEEP